jgi:uncharacterized protein (TIGR03435 family)
MAFDVASVRLASRKFTESNFPWEDGEPYPPNGGHFSARNSLVCYIAFAYKLEKTPYEEASMLAHQPKWVGSDYFVIQARGSGNPTRDQMRLMMQSLLADRFKLIVHFESRETEALALTLIQPGKTGPGLRPHSEGPPCSSPQAPFPRSSSEKRTEAIPYPCGPFFFERLPGNLLRQTARNITMQDIATAIGEFGQLGRPVVDRTGLSGAFDFRIEWTPEPNPSAPSSAEEQSDLSGPSFYQALKQQLGLKLIKTRARLQVLVIDHVERPSAN